MAAWIPSHPSQHFLQSFSVLLYKLVLISIGYCNSPHVTFKYSIDFFNLYATFFGYQYQGGQLFSPGNEIRLIYLFYISKTQFR